MVKIHKITLLMSLIFNQVVFSAENPAQPLTGLESFKKGLNSVVRTVKSDLSIGDDIDQHVTFFSQCAAASRLVAYNMAIDAPVIIYCLKTDAFKRVIKIDIDMKKLLFLSFVLAPLTEELLFTYLPQRLLKKCFNEKELCYRNGLSLLPATCFGLAHYHKPLPLMVTASIASFIHHRYLLKRENNTVPVLSHSLFNAATIPLATGIFLLYKHKYI